jgi:hypothetical protein
VLLNDLDLPDRLVGGQRRRVNVLRNAQNDVVIVRILKREKIVIGR